MAVRINRVYTRAGDDGATALVGGRRVAQGLAAHRGLRHHRRAELVVGLARAFNAPRLKRGKNYRSARRDPAPDPERAVRSGQRARHPARVVLPGHVSRGRRRGHRAREADGRVPEGPRPAQVLRAARGAGRVGGFLHQARTVCHAPSAACSRSRGGGHRRVAAQYVNRLSDLFFVLSRWVGKHLGETEYLWERGLASHARKR